MDDKLEVGREAWHAEVASHSMTRRTFSKLALAGAFTKNTIASPLQQEIHNPLQPLASGIKIALQVPPDPADEDLQFARQLGLEYVSIFSSGSQATLENFQLWKQRVEGAGLKVWNIGNGNVHNMPEVTLNLPGRDQKIEEYKHYLRNLAQAGIYYTTYGPVANGIWSSEPETTRGNAPTRAFHLQTAKGYWAGKVFEGPLTHGRRYSQEELWENYTYFIRQVVPLAEELGIRIGIHPEDPPVPELGGVPRCIFGNFAGYVRALEIANSPNIGVCLCCGTWLEGGTGMGKDVIEAIRAFSRMGRLWKIHFRNVSAPIPHFVETFLDNGYMDMWRIMKVLCEVDFRGALIADHVPTMVGGRLTSLAYSIGYIKGLLARTDTESKS